MRARASRTGAFYRMGGYYVEKYYHNNCYYIR
jgi:hypothetical protein